MTSSPKSLPHHICLTGFMASGKSSVAAALARLLGRDAVDLDAEIARRSGRSIAQMFRHSGESDFRKIESSTLTELLSAPDEKVIALGGGTWVQPDNENLLGATGAVIVFLDAAPEDLWQRVNKDGAGSRPLVQDEHSFRKLYEERRPHYLRAHRRVETAGKSPAQVALEIVDLLTLED